ncbi:MAG: DUF1499 domain-containing protein [Pseudomonadota bacterium]
MKRTIADRLAMIAKFETISAVLILLIAGPGHRFGLIPTKFAVLMSLGALILGAVALLCAILALVLPTMRRRTAMLAGCVLISGALTATLVSWVIKGASVPQIHDITTDVGNPPQFDILAGARAGAANPDAYPGEAFAKQQLEAYPDIQPLVVPGNDAARVLDAAEAAAVAQGWQAVVRQDGSQQIEATDVTFWYGYKDDIIIRVSQGNAGVIVDVRSKSRVGQSDLGTNAQRIRDYLATLKASLGVS